MMVSSSAPTVSAYLAELPREKAAVLRAVRKVMKQNLPKGFVETMNWGMISYEVPLQTFPNTYNGKPLAYAGLAAQKNNFAVYLMNVYGNKDIESWFRNEFKKRKLKLDMGKSCVRFKKLEDLPLDVIGQTIAKTTLKDYIAYYEKSRKK